MVLRSLNTVPDDKYGVTPSMRLSGLLADAIRNRDWCHPVPQRAQIDSDSVQEVLHVPA
jgi:hypothetical protein